MGGHPADAEQLRVQREETGEEELDVGAFDPRTGPGGRHLAPRVAQPSADRASRATRSG